MVILSLMCMYFLKYTEEVMRSQNSLNTEMTHGPHKTTVLWSLSVEAYVSVNHCNECLFSTLQQLRGRICLWITGLVKAH